MIKQAVIAIFDIGKTNKKVFLFNEQYEVVYGQSEQLSETVDEDGDACENLDSLRSFVFHSLSDVVKRTGFTIKAINFSSYGASLVYIDETGKILTPLYNYLKAYPPELKQKFYDTYGGEAKISKETASPVLDSLNSGMQLYRIKYEHPELFSKIRFALHLPEYLSYLLTGKVYSGITSIGCHTNLWDYTRNNYHSWVKQEGIFEKLAPVAASDSVIDAVFNGNKYKVGIGLHDSSAALMPYLINFQAPFVLISTGTWCISLNPFNHSALKDDELRRDCLCYMQYKGKPVKASRLFAGYEHEQQVKRIAAYFNKDLVDYKTITFNPEIIPSLDNQAVHSEEQGKLHIDQCVFGKRDLSVFSSYEDAYHQLMLDIVSQQYHSTQLVLKGTDVKNIFVDGGFSSNAVYMNLLASFFPEIEVFAASMAQATALGTAFAIHQHWNTHSISNKLIKLKHFEKRFFLNGAVNDKRIKTRFNYRPDRRMDNS